MIKSIAFVRIACLAVFAVFAAVACKNTSGLDEAPRATFSQIACLDINGDNIINSGDAAEMSELPDFNADGDRDEFDASFLNDANVQLDPNRDKSVCDDDTDAPEYLVAHGYFDPSNVDCDDGDAVLLVGVGGGVVNLKDETNAAGIRDVVDELLKEYDDRDVQTIGVIAGPAVIGAAELHGAMEDWIANITRVYLDHYPCLRTVMLGHSHGALTVDVTAARLEAEYADRIIAVVDVDRFESLYTGDTTTRPTQVSVFNVFLPGEGFPYDSGNAENWDASGETAPKEGEGGGPQEPVRHTTIDNSRAVRDRIVEWVMERTGSS